MNINLFIEKAKQIHGNKYDYSQLIYSKTSNEILTSYKNNIVCPVHGKFEQVLNSHLKGHGCIKCCCSHKINNKEHFILKSNIKHKNKYDYTKTIYTGLKNKLIITCPIHGDFIQLANKHICGQGCPKCGHIKSNLYNKSTKDIFINKAKLIHGNKYNYSLINYDTNRIKVKIICQIHGEFEQTPSNHLKGHGCPKCINIISKGESEITNLLNNIKIIRNSRSIIKPYELDIYLPDYKLAIEYNGVYWHSYFNKSKFKHNLKHDLCDKLGIKLLQITDYEWRYYKDIIKSIILSQVNISTKVNASKCKVKELSNKEFNEFTIRTNLQGKINTHVKLGLIINNKLVYVMGFNKYKKYEWKLTRYSSELNINIINGANKLLRYFINKTKPKVIISNINRRYNIDNFHKKSGFKLLKITKPNYFYIKGDRQYNKNKVKVNYKFQKYWDAGLIKYILKI
jgi:hypothetical protein